MKKPSSAKLNRQVLEEASEWFVDFRVGDVDAAARERFDEWLRRSPEHIRAYWEIAKSYVELPALTPADKLDVAELIAYAHSDDNVVPLHPGVGTRAPHVLCVDNDASANTHRANTGWGRELPVRRRFLVAASIAIMLAIAGAVVWQTQRYALYTTDIGERRSITLADGSTVDLNARSRLRIEFSDTERRVELLDGQALFQVAKDPRRPFIVRSGETIVRAVGTQFDVYLKDSGTTVTVLEGRVAVYSTAHREAPAAETEQNSPHDTNGPDIAQHALPRASWRDAHVSSMSTPGSLPAPPPGLLDPSGSGAVFLSAGEQVTVTPEAIAVPHRADANVATAWMQRRLIFQGSKLSDVVDEFNRYNRTQLVIEDPRLKDLQISGVYSSTDPASLLRFLRDQGVRVTDSDSTVRIEAQ
jgi:transmembrane sensor